MTNWQKFTKTIATNPISAFAVLCVACTAAFLGYLAVWQTNILSSPTWCAKAMGAEKMLPGQSVQQTMEALKSCNKLLEIQVTAIATDSHMNHGAFGLVLVILIVVVIAGARASFKAGKDGIEGNVGRDHPQEQKIEGEVTLTPKVAD